MTAEKQRAGAIEIMLAATSVVLLTIGISSTAWWLAGRPTAEWPAWIEAGATLAAVGAAIVAGLYAARAFRLESDREHRWEKDNRATQASRVVAWPLEMQWRKGPFDEQTGQYPVMEVSGLNVRVRNASDLPVAKVRLAATIVVGRADGFAEELDFGSTAFFSVEPETTTDVVVSATHGDAIRLVTTQRVDPRYETRVFLQFVDAAGRSWTRRLHEGELRDAGTLADRTVVVPGPSSWQRWSPSLRRQRE